MIMKLCELGGYPILELLKARGVKIWKQSMVWYGYFLESPIGKGLLSEMSLLYGWFV